ncbi:hypothetical protein ED733_002618 [Metarhizium rileyi]|uniref:C2H2-type domain-containing protein n=1 Tax=Metarhizium rileyi (strain RCEF 4871) TaxID=1649241 RepID=A0A5C6G6Y0_METRR|nr:hypothetical protein ED733_002618 [Metarhizium rileyi]
MEPTTKKRKLAPKVNASPAASLPGTFAAATAATTAAAAIAATQYTHESSLSQSQHHAAHDVSISERQDFESFARHLQDAAMLIQRQTERPPYRDVSVLLLSWEEDRSVHDDVAALEQVLQNKYNYATQSWQIPTVPNPSIKLGVQIASFLETARPNHLLIIYYAGHGYLGVDGHVYWACGRDDAAKLKWDGVRCLFEDAQSDILLLLDSCATPDPPAAGSHGIKQGIAAFSPEHSPREQGSHSFTAHLVEALQKLYSGRPFSVDRLYEELVAQRQLQNAQAATRPPNHGPPAVPMQGQSPLLFTLTPGKGQRLTMTPLPSRPFTPTQNGGEPSEGHALRGRDDYIMDPESVADIRFDEARILVCTTFVGDASTDMSYFNQWLQETPPLGSKIAVEGMFLGPPTMLLISMPHSIWNIVQHDKVCCFLGYVSSHNMLHLYERLVGPAGVRPSAKEVEDGRILLEARDFAAETPARAAHRETEHHDPMYHASAPRDHPEAPPQSSPSQAAPFSLGSSKPKDDVEDSAEMQEAAEQLKALSHVRHRSDEAAPGAERVRTSLPDLLSNDTHRIPQGTNDAAVDNSALLIDVAVTPSSKNKGPRRSVVKQEFRCNHCSHAPFRDSSSLRKHVAAAHTRPFPCAFSFAGCTSTFGSKNEWKRHIASQHLCLQYYRCSACPQNAVEGKGNEFNRKDLFTQHLRRMHAPFQIKRAISQDGQMQSDWDAHVKGMQKTCLVTRRQPPQRAACPKPDCRKEFDGPNAWDEWTEHVGRHMEKGEGTVLGADGLLAKWALDEGIIEPKGDGEYRLCATNGLLGSSQGSAGPTLDRKDSLQLSFTDSSQIDDTLMVDSKPGDRGVDIGQANAA